MSEKNKNGKVKKIILTVAASSAAITSPLLILAGTDDINTVSNANTKFAADWTVYVNSFQGREEYKNVENINFGMGKAKDKVMTYDDAIRTVKFAKSPTKDDWNQDEQTWELIYESGTLSDDIFRKGTFWKNEYSFGQRTYGFAISSDLEIVPGTLSIKMEYMGVEDDNHISLNENERRRNMAYSISGTNPNNPKEKLENKYGTYIRFADENGYFDLNADQEFGQNSNLVENNFWIQDQRFNFNIGSHRKGNWMYNWWEPNDPNNPEPFSINTIPEYENLGAYRPAIDGIEFLTSDAKYKNVFAKGFTPSQMDIMMSMTQIPDQDKPLGYSRYFGIGLDTDKYLKQLSRRGSDYNALASDTGSIFLVHYFTGLEQNRYDSDKRPIPLVTIKFKTRRKYDDSLINVPKNDNAVETINSYLSKKQTNENHSSFVTGLFHSDKDQTGSARDPHSWWAFDKTIENTGYDTSRFNTWYRNPSGMGNIDNQYTGVATSYAVRTFNRNININLTEKINIRDGKNDIFPKISGFEVLKNGQKIDSISLPWIDDKNRSPFLDNKEYKTALKNYLLNIENVNDLDNLTLRPIMSDPEGSFKWNTNSTLLKFDENSGTLTGTITYSISDEQVKKENLDDKFISSKLPSELLYNDTPLTLKQRGVIRAAISNDFERKRFDGYTLKVGDTTVYNDFWKDLIKSISKANKEKSKLAEADTTSFIDTVNYRLSDNKMDLDKLLEKVNELKSIDLDNFKIGTKLPSNEIYVQNGLDPRTVDFESPVSKLKTAIAAMNGQSVYDNLVSEMNKKVEQYDKSLQLWSVISIATQKYLA
ncbi:hypothetical protein ACNQ1N_01755 [Mycoplasma sp. HF11B]|uniref:hypothetical protein n=1 Tax=Mycoplasma sp. HF11B TaxID=3401681 RepID=UPI003AAAA2D7